MITNEDGNKMKKDYSEFKDILVLRSYLTYGKWENKTLNNQYVLNNRNQIIKHVEFYTESEGTYSQVELEDFLKGEYDNLYIDFNDFDCNWDCPTGIILSLYTGERLLDVIEEEKNKEIKETIKFLEREIR